MKVAKSIHILFICFVTMLFVGCMEKTDQPDSRPPIIDARPPIIDARPPIIDARPPIIDAAVDGPVADAGSDADLGGFCGFSTGGLCITDADCYESGCSGQVCQSVEEDPVYTTCEWRECYDDEAFGVECGCVAGSCVWTPE